MKNKLLITTALVALVSANNAFADYTGEPETDLAINGEQTISDKDLYYYKSISVAEDGRIGLLMYWHGLAR